MHFPKKTNKILCCTGSAHIAHTLEATAKVLICVLGCDLNGCHLLLPPVQMLVATMIFFRYCENRKLLYNDC